MKSNVEHRYDYFKHNFYRLDKIPLTDARDVELYFYTGMRDNNMYLVKQVLRFCNVPDNLTLQEQICYYQLLKGSL